MNLLRIEILILAFNNKYKFFFLNPGKLIQHLKNRFIKHKINLKLNSFLFFNQSKLNKNKK